MKKIALLLTAATSFVAAEAHKGFSVGLNAGYANIDAKSRFTTNATNSPTRNNDISGRGFLGGLGLGYFHAMNNLNLGLQLQGNLGTASGKNEQTGLPATSNYKLELKQKWEANASVRLGMNMNGAVPYVRVGGSLSKFSATSTSDAVGGTPSQTTNKQLFGVLAGAGVDVAINDRMTVGVDFRATFYPSFDAKQTGTTGANPLIFTHNIKPTTLVTSVGVKYFF